MIVKTLAGGFGSNVPTELKESESQIVFCSAVMEIAEPIVTIEVGTEISTGCT